MSHSILLCLNPLLTGGQLWACQIDFATQPSSTNMPPYHIVGTPPYASLNMYNGMCKSLYLYSRPASYLKGMQVQLLVMMCLGYSLLNLACADFPLSYNVHHGTRKTWHNQVQIKKQQYSGTDLAPDGLTCIGEMIDYACSLKLPNYNLLHSQVAMDIRYFTLSFHIFLSLFIYNQAYLV